MIAQYANLYILCFYSINSWIACGPYWKWVVQRYFPLMGLIWRAKYDSLFYNIATFLHEHFFKFPLQNMMSALVIYFFYFLYLKFLDKKNSLYIVTLPFFFPCFYYHLCVISWLTFDLLWCVENVIFELLSLNFFAQNEIF